MQISVSQLFYIVAHRGYLQGVINGVKLKADDGQRLLQAQLLRQVRGAIISPRITNWEALTQFIELSIGKESWDPKQVNFNKLY